ncbi:glycine--tRNA ligase subunit beta [Virgibacillus sp. W0181]|uniref:glycine--tRNA ligase subunit beta n=1 Tax=Virgibacillus sp. W0181 TaxID=3391581 RepID=UPI003F481F64
MRKDVLFEIGLEELPARFIDDAERQLLNKTEKWLTELRISYHEIITYSTPRRLTVLIKEIAPEQTTIEEETKGPSVSIAKDEAGNWTKAAIGFTKGQGKTTNDIYLKDIKGTNYIYVKNHIEGKQTIELLPDFKQIIESIQFRQNMRWGKKSIRYARPIRWLVALYDNEIVPFEISGVQTSNWTYGHRFLGSTIYITDPAEYEQKLLEQFVVVSPDKRQKMIVNEIKAMEEKENFNIAVDEDLLQEVRNLVEYPSVFCGTFSSDFLKLPSEVLITSMKEHQRYFPVASEDGNLLPHFVGVRNGDKRHLDNVIKGNEKVLRARLKDAQFFYEEDKSESISFYLAKLERVVFQDKLGTIADKVKRVVKITHMLSEKLQLDEQTEKQAARAAEISKFDLMTNMVNEFTELQGFMGEKYAIHFGENPVVAQAVREHYLPIHATDKLPETIVGALVSIADKIDTIVGCIAVGLVPTSSQDPYGLRRQGIGILNILKDRKWNITLDDLILSVQKLYRESSIEQRDMEQVSNDLSSFFNQRLVYLFKESGLETDVVQAVLHRTIGQLSYTLDKAVLLSKKRNEPSFKRVEEALVRVINLSKKEDSVEQINQKLFKTTSEKLLFEKYEDVQQRFKKANEKQEAKNGLNYLAELTDPIHDFFDNNMVMADDVQLKNNRIALITHVSNLILNYADLSLIEWKQQF